MLDLVVRFIYTAANARLVFTKWMWVENETLVCILVEIRKRNKYRTFIVCCRGVVKESKRLMYRPVKIMLSVMTTKMSGC